MKEQLTTLIEQSEELRSSLTALLPMLRAISGGYPAVFVAEKSDTLPSLVNMVFESDSITPDAVKKAYAEADLDDAAHASALLVCGDTAALISLSPICYCDAVKCGKALIAASKGDKSLLDSYTAPEVCGTAKRLKGKVAIVTGAAQGFGAGIADSMASEGAHIVIADLNGDGAKAAAEELCRKYGSHAAVAVTANVSDEESVKAMVETAVLAFGGLDVLVNNAGIVRAGSLAEMQKKDFELVTAVNYTAYFLCTKYSVIPMKAARAVCPDITSDIIEINSKSGLAGSNKNFAYAGSKFGGIGLTQSFALELAEYGIKVNAICPGNFLDGPLWSDPEKGLFVQYLNAGKVPGAKTVDDVRKFYEAKVPLGRGCRTEDVARAILYVIEQQYETGQAIPVTGGQEMLK